MSDPVITQEMLIQITKLGVMAEKQRKDERRKQRQSRTQTDSRFADIEDPREKRHLIAESLTTKYHIITISGVKDDEVYIYKEGVYYPGGRAILEAELESILIWDATKKEIQEIIAKIKRQTYKRPDELQDPPENLVPLRNGVYDITTKALLPHNPERVFFTQLPVDYVPGAKCNAIQRFLDQVVAPEDLALLQEWIGYCLYRKYHEKKALILIGERDTGKTTLLTVMTSMLGKNNVSGETLQSINKSNFSAFNLKNKYANIADELPSREITDVAGFKKLTGGGVYWAEQKFKDRVPFENYAKLTYSANKMPKVTEEQDEAFYSRWLISLFNHIIEEDMKDKRLIEKLTTSEELSGLLNWAIEGLERLLTNGRFSYRYTIEDNKYMLTTSADPVAAFIRDCIQEEPGVFISKELLYRVFVEYCTGNKYEVISKTKLTQELNRKIASMTEGQRDYSGKPKEHCWINVDLKKDKKSTFTTFTTFFYTIGNLSSKTLMGFDVVVSKPVNVVTEDSPVVSFDTVQSERWIKSSQDILTFLKLRGKASPEDIAENSPLDIEAIEREVKLLASNGDIFENPKGTWRLLT